MCNARVSGPLYVLAVLVILSYFRSRQSLWCCLRYRLLPQKLHVGAHMLRRFQAFESLIYIYIYFFWAKRTSNPSKAEDFFGHWGDRLGFFEKKRDEVSGEVAAGFTRAMGLGLKERCRPVVLNMEPNHSCKRELVLGPY